MLGRREYSESDLRQKLIRRGYTPEEAEDAITFVKTHGYQSDERYAGMKARSISRRAGDVKVVLTLKAKGISDALAKSQIIELDSDAERAFALAKGRFEKILAGESLSIEAKQKVYRFLAGRGFSVASIKDALARLVLTT
jgi:regulatory protein